MLFYDQTGERCEMAGWHWIVARTQSSRESYAAFHINRSGYEYYLPMARDDDKVFPLFRSYIFVRTFNFQFYDLMTTYGVTGVVRQGDIPCLCPDRVIESLKQLEARGVIPLTKPPFKAGDRVRVTKGHLAGRIGLLISTCGRERARVLMSILGGGATIKLKTSLLETA